MRTPRIENLTSQSVCLDGDLVHHALCLLASGKRQIIGAHNARIKAKHARDLNEVHFVREDDACRRVRVGVC